MSSLKEIGKEYQNSCRLLSKKMKELNNRKKQLEESKIKVKRKNAIEYVDNEIHQLKDRLNKLARMYRTTREIGIEARNYYNKEWWRSEEYTVNSRKSRPYIPYYGATKYDYEYESYSNQKDEK
ncbi:hypothetical protein [Tepidibacter formicigenes]|jgi:predicted  nucleic acid-binding Zn-ribbon protein|uniref:Uncharacterized protein n=1 Tax=Tepidibacter formicigenes DSM 15518 TaxID=1123349 RepID=A0A1M6SNN0_9FIRM|nr:hypothetical protein [Tepidibacter formicigenes]SHK46303.1 hypothetical protein SAMN02744037_02393 [Tepidibacter formicigenes DSM 15518]